MFRLDRDFLFYLPGLLIAFTVHEFAHGYVSYKLGDPTPKAQGRLSLNPIHHIDPVGFLMMVIFRFGWCKPVQINPFYFEDRRKGVLWVALAGPMANFITAFVAAFGFALASLFLPASLMFNSIFTKLFIGLILYNINLGLFNLIPIAPLDGSKVLEGLLSPANAYKYSDFMNRYGFFILLGIMFSGAYRYIIGPPAQLMFSSLLNLMRIFI
ncbi:MAG: site-2 protease family protein [Firmicutes bacterium]|jgi:Zn-dependent protease|nr:site-2 protease family protein [Bacillota bacterium]